jgi:hypothetical protein
MATHTCSMPIFSKSKQVMPQMVAMRQSHPPNTDQQVVATGTRYLCVRWQLPNQQMPCNSQGILGRSICVKILRVSASQQLCPHLFIRTRWQVKFLCPWQCYTSHFSHLMLRPTLQTHENPEIIQDIQAICKVAVRFAEWKHDTIRTWGALHSNVPQHWSSWLSRCHHTQSGSNWCSRPRACS